MTELIPANVVEEVLPLFPACHHDTLRKLFKDPTSLGEMERVLLEGLIAQVQRTLTMEVHAEFERILRKKEKKRVESATDALDEFIRTYRPAPEKEYTHWLIAYNPEGEAVAFALDENDERTAEAALRWLREGRSVKLVTAEEGRRLFDIATKR